MLHHLFFLVIIGASLVATGFEISKDDAPNDFLDIEEPSPKAREKFIKEDLMQWFEQHMPPEMMQGWRLAESPDAGWGVFATRYLPARTAVLTIPQDLRIHRDTVCGAGAGMGTAICELVISLVRRGLQQSIAFRELLREHAFPFQLSELNNIEAALILANMKFCGSSACRGQPQMKWKTWVEHLEVRPGLPVCSYNHSQLSDEGFPLSEVVRLRRRLYERQFEMIMDLIRRARWKEDNWSWLTLPRWLWACCLVNSRIFGSEGILPLFDSINFDSRYEMLYDHRKPGRISCGFSHDFASGDEIRWAFFGEGGVDAPPPQPDVFVTYGMLDVHDACVDVNISSNAEMHPWYTQAERTIKPPLSLPGSSFVACFRPKGKLTPAAAGNVPTLIEYVERQLEMVQECLQLAKTKSIRSYCEHQEPLLQEFLGRLRKDNGGGGDGGDL